MTQRHGLAVISATVALAVFGSGCSRAPSAELSPSNHEIQSGVGTSSTLSNPQPLNTHGVNPHDLSRKITFIGGNSLIMRQAFRGHGGVLALAQGFGQTVDGSIAIKDFSPGNLAEIEWKESTKISTPTSSNSSHTTQQQYIGSIMSGNLRDSHVLYPPMYWKQGSMSAVGTGILWLSQDVYQDLAKVHTSTLKYGFEDGQLLEFASSTPALRQQILDLQSEITKVIDRKDVFATTATTGVRDVVINGTTSTVEVLIAKNWFGEIQILNNPENPLVLSMRVSTPGGIDFGGLFDYTITEIKDVQQ